MKMKRLLSPSAGAGDFVSNSTPAFRAAYDEIDWHRETPDPEFRNLTAGRQMKKYGRCNPPPLHALVIHIGRPQPS